jgi:hypothetical protein
MVSGSSSWFILADDPCRPAALLVLDLSRAISSRNRCRIVVGATRRASHSGASGVAGQIVEELDGIVRDDGIARQQPDVGVEPGRLHVVVAGADVHVAAQAARLLANDERKLRVCLEPADAERDVRADPFELRAQCRLRASSKRAFNSITQATCLPCSAARMSDLTKGVSSPIR